MERAEKMGNACIAGMPEVCGREHLPGAGKKIAWMRALLSERRMACLEELAMIYRYIDGIEDSVVRQVMTLRYVDGKTWQEVARGIGEHDEQYPRRIHDAYLLNCRRYGEGWKRSIRRRKEQTPYGEQNEGNHGETEAVCGLLR